MDFPRICTDLKIILLCATNLFPSCHACRCPYPGGSKGEPQIHPPLPKDGWLLWTGEVKRRVLIQKKNQANRLKRSAKFKLRQQQSPARSCCREAFFVPCSPVPTRSCTLWSLASDGGESGAMRAQELWASYQRNADIDANDAHHPIRPALSVEEGVFFFVACLHCDCNRRSFPAYTFAAYNTRCLSPNFRAPSGPGSGHGGPRELPVLYMLSLCTKQRGRFCRNAQPPPHKYTAPIDRYRW